MKTYEFLHLIFGTMQHHENSHAIIGWIGVLGFSIFNIAEFNEVAKLCGSVFGIIFIVLGIILRIIQIKKERK